MKNVIKHGKYTHIRTCSNCDCVFLYFDNGSDNEDVRYDWDYVDKKKHTNFKFIQKRLYCPECGYTILIPADKVKEDDNNTLLINKEI